MSDLENMKNLEESLQNNGSSEKVQNEAKPKKEFGIVDGLKILDRSELPFGGVFYPESWKFAYRCPTTKEVANFSTIQENDQARIISATEDLVKSCFTIIDTDKQKEVSTNEINDGERLFFFLKLREYFLHDKPIEYVVMSAEKQEPVTVRFLASSLIYPTPKTKLLECFDGRMFTIPMPNSNEEIKFLIPTLGRSNRLFNFMMKKYKEANKEDSDGKAEADAFDKQFLYFAPFLFETGNEKIAELKAKYKKIISNEPLMKAYLSIINKMKLTNKESLIIDEESEEETPIKFPGGWKSIFDDKSTFEDLF